MLASYSGLIVRCLRGHSTAVQHGVGIVGGCVDILHDCLDAGIAEFGLWSSGSWSDVGGLGGAVV